MKTHYYLKIAGVPAEREYNALPFGRKITHQPAIMEFQQRAQSVHISAKRRSYDAAIREFKRLYQPAEWYCIASSGPDWHDDSLRVWYTTAAPAEPEPPADTVAPLPGAADLEFNTRLEAERCTWEFRQKLSRPLDSGRRPFLESPLFGEQGQGSLF
jgi:hypothetical protein